MSPTDHEHTFLRAARCACGVDYSDVLDLLFAARGDAERLAGEAHYTGSCLRPESETLELWLFDAPSQVVQELEANRPGVYLIHNDAPRPRAALRPLTHSFDVAPMQSEGIVVTRVSVSEDGYLQVDVVDDVQAAQTRLDAIYGSHLVRVVQGGYGIPGRAIASFPDRHFQFWEYRIGHGVLLVRSPNVRERTMVDLIFEMVMFVSLPRSMRGVRLEEGTAEDVERLTAANSEVGQTLNRTKWTIWAEEEFLNSGPRPFALVSENNRNLIVAGQCWVEEHEGNMFDSPFDFDR